jgi:hypothetical protein
MTGPYLHGWAETEEGLNSQAIELVYVYDGVAKCNPQISGGRYESSLS